MERFAGLGREEIAARRDGKLPTINFSCKDVPKVDSLHGRVGGQIQRFMRTLIKKLGYDRPSVHRNRNGSGFHAYADRPMKDFSEFSEFKKEYNRLIPILRKVVRNLCDKGRAGKSKTPPPPRVHFGLSVISSMQPGVPAVWRLYLNFHYQEGFPVTPIEFL